MNDGKIGQTAVRELVVTKKDLACAVGSGSVEVFATPMVAAIMEGAAADLAQTFLTDEFTTVGSKISMEHLCPTVEGVTVRAEAELVETDGRKYQFVLRAYDNAGMIARGEHERVSVRRESFLKKAAARSEVPAPKYKAVLFDLDGTLTESHPGVISAVKEALDRMGIPAPEDSILKKFVGPPLQCSFAEYCGMTPDQCEAAVDIFRETYPKKGAFENSVFEGMHELLKDLQARGIKTMVATSKAESAAKIILDYFELSPVIDYLAGAREDQGRQPKSELILRGLRKYQIDPKDAVMIGDTHFDADGARDSGTDFIGVLFGYGTKEEMEASGGKKFAATVEELHGMLLEG